MMVKRYANLRMSEGLFWFLGKRELRPCVVWLLFGVVPVFVEQKALVGWETVDSRRQTG